MKEVKQRVTVLGSTGSVGMSTLDVISRHLERFEVFALSAAVKVDELLEQCARFKPRFAVMASAPHAVQLESPASGNGRRRPAYRWTDTLLIRYEGIPVGAFSPSTMLPITCALSATQALSATCGAIPSSS